MKQFQTHGKVLIYLKTKVESLKEVMIGLGLYFKSSNLIFQNRSKFYSRIKQFLAEVSLFGSIVE